VQQVLDHLRKSGEIEIDERSAKSLQAAALVHDVGHGPFSHLLEGERDKKHEKWSCEIIRSEETGINQILKKEGLVDDVVSLIEKDTYTRPYWQKSLISSQLDMDRLDYLMRDSHFLGVEYGKFDWYRLIHTLGVTEHRKQLYLVWPEKTKYAIEEYIFARYYMYQSVYFHHCTRGYERLLRGIWRRAKEIQEASAHPLSAFLGVPEPSLHDYLQFGECHLLAQLQIWKDSKDEILKDLCARFLLRKGFGVIEMERSLDGMDAHGGITRAFDYLRGQGYREPQYYLLEDRGDVGVYEPYRPEKDRNEQTPMTAILLRNGNNELREISEVLRRLHAVTAQRDQFIRYYCPKEHRDKVRAILAAPAG
jgi:HD superfamily phosphohydrolase